MAKPEKTFRQGCVSVSIFENEMNVNGSNVVRMNAVPQKSYKDKDGNWKHTTSFGVNEIPKLIVSLSKAYDFLTSKTDGEE